MPREQLCLRGHAGVVESRIFETVARQDRLLLAGTVQQPSIRALEAQHVGGLVGSLGSKEHAQPLEAGLVLAQTQEARFVELLRRQPGASRLLAAEPALEPQADGLGRDLIGSRLHALAAGFLERGRAAEGAVES